MDNIYNVALFINVLLTACAFSRADSLCKESNPCRCTLNNGSSIDLSTVGKDNNIPLFYYVPYLHEQEDNTTIVEGLFSYNPCYDFTENLPGTTTPQSEAPCKNAAACRTNPGKSNGSLPESYAIGTHKRAAFYLIDKFYYINYTVPEGKSNLSIKLICDDTVSTHTLVVQLVSGTRHEMSLTSKCACPGMCESKEPVTPAEKHGLSTGSVLLITFFTILLVYVFLGMTWNFCNGAHGIELLPNIKFWSDVPQLIVDGFLFTCSCCSKQSQSSYADM